jgi:hypothetical protein
VQQRCSRRLIDGIKVEDGRARGSKDAVDLLSWGLLGRLLVGQRSVVGGGDVSGEGAKEGRLVEVARFYGTKRRGFRCEETTSGSQHRLEGLTEDGINNEISCSNVKAALAGCIELGVVDARMSEEQFD